MAFGKYAYRTELQPLPTSAPPNNAELEPTDAEMAAARRVSEWIDAKRREGENVLLLAEVWLAEELFERLASWKTKRAPFSFNRAGDFEFLGVRVRNWRGPVVPGDGDITGIFAS